MTSARKLVLISLSGLLLTAATCPPAEPVVTVHYRQVGACNGYQRGTGPVNAGVNGAFVAFKVISIDNSKRSTAFNFDPTRMFVNGTSDHISTSLSLAQDLAPLSAVPVTVPAMTHQGNNGIGVVRVSTAAADGASEANNTNYILAYERGPGDPGVLLQKQNAGQTTFANTPNCTSITF